VNDNEIMNRVNALPERFADRLDQAGLDDVRGAARAGEWGEALEVLMGGLVKAQVPVSVGESEELRWLLSALGLPVDAVGRLNLRG
jgi:hypothetical protein